jgi:hypothetical protein
MSCPNPVGGGRSSAADDGAATAGVAAARPAANRPLLQMFMIAVPPSNGAP